MSLLDKATIITTPTAHSEGKLHSIKGGAVADFDVVRGSAATRVNAEGLIEDIRIIGDEEIANGDFYNGSTDWTLGTGWSISDGKAVAVSGASTKLIQSISGLSGKTCKVSFTLSDFGGNGSVRVDFGSVSSDPINTNGEHIVYGAYDNNAFELFKNTGFEGSIDNISVKEVIDATNIPRIDYTDGTASILLEPQSTNLIPYSEEITQFDQNNVTTLNNQTISADGTQNASKVTKLGVSANDRLKEDISISSATSYNVSVFLKNDTIDGTTSLGIRISGGTLFRLGFDWNGSTPSISASYSNGTRTNEIIENYGNGWYRVGYSFVSDGTNADFELDLDRGNGSDTTSLFVWGAQLEELPYATSYIPTSGAIATRLADVVTGAGDATTFNSTEGVLYAEISRSEDEGTYRLLGIDNGTASNYIKVGFSNTGTFWMRAVVNGVTAVNSENIPSNGNQFYKIALKYKSGESSIHIDGTKVVTSATTFSSGNFTDLQFTHFNGALSFYDKVKSVITFDTALTDAELECLTTI